MKKIKFITPLVGLATITPITVLNTSCSQSKWANTVYVQLGDSITWNDGHTDSKTHETLRGYRTHMESMGFKYINNMAYSGGCIADHPESPYFDLPWVVSTINFADYGLVTFAAGVNDFLYQPSEMGEFKKSDFDKKTFIGAYQYMIEKIRSENPNIKIAIFTPFICRTYKAPNKRGHILQDYVDATIKVAELYNVPCLDLFRNSGITEQNIDEFTFDRLHLNNKGYDLISAMMIDFLNKI